MVTLSGGAALEAKLKELAAKLESGKTLRVGFLEGATYPDGTSVAAVAAWQNFGTGRIPPRPFFSNLVKEKGASWGDALANLLVTNNYNAGSALALAGQGIAGQLRQAVVDMNAPALSPTTLILRERFWTNPGDIKGADVGEAARLAATGYKPNVSGSQAKPLIWTGTLLNAIDSEVTG